ncbi:MAG: phosphoribosylglycinamide formyltransferase [Calditrichaeota bacterium]|nr:MAG: phosphoribosylglycinamide formyltransferase [Calditrichota bacterium]
MTNIAVFASGRGSNFQAVYRKVEEGFIPARISLLVTDNSGAPCIAFARTHHIPVRVIRPRDYASPEAFGDALLRCLQEFGIGFIVLAGYLKKIPANVVEAYPNRIVNIHPALLPAFGGKGMYGMKVHEAVFRSGAKVSGVTVHMVNNEYDAGPIVLQEAVDISDCASPEEIARRVLEREHEVFPRAIKLLLENEVLIDGRRVTIRKPTE